MRLDTPRYRMALLDLNPANDVRLFVLVPASVAPAATTFADASRHAYLAMNLQLLQPGHCARILTIAASWRTRTSIFRAGLLGCDFLGIYGTVRVGEVAVNWRDGIQKPDR